MADNFFDEMQTALRTEAERRGVTVTPAVWREFCAAASPPPPAAVEPPARRPVPARPDAERQPSRDGLRPLPPTPQVGGLDFPALQRCVAACQRCALCQSRKHTVFGEGDVHARLMFIGEGPGAEEDATGRPFVGEAGQLLDKMIAAMQFARSEVYIANVVKCRPPGNRTPDDAEAAACLIYLRRQIELVKPEVIVLLGATPLRFLLKKVGITRLRGQWDEYEGIPVMPTFHPAFLLRKPPAKKEVWADLQEVMRRFGKVYRRA